MRQNRVCVVQSNYTQLSGEAQGKQKAFSRPVGNDISARQVLSQRIALSLDDLYFLKLKVWIFFLWFPFLFWKCVVFCPVSLVQSYHPICGSQTSRPVEAISNSFLCTVLHISFFFFFRVKNKILGFSALCSFHPRIMIFEILFTWPIAIRIAIW